MKSVESRCPQRFEIIFSDFANRARSCIRSHSFHPRETSLEVTDYVNQFGSACYKRVSILEKHRVRTIEEPLHGCLECGRIHRAAALRQSRHFTTNSRRLHVMGLLNLQQVLIHEIDVSLDVCYRPLGESERFVHRTECTAIPCTVAGDSNKQTLSFTRGTDRTLFKPLVAFGNLRRICQCKSTSLSPRKCLRAWKKLPEPIPRGLASYFPRITCRSTIRPSVF